MSIPLPNPNIEPRIGDALPPARIEQALGEIQQNLEALASVAKRSFATAWVEPALLNSWANFGYLYDLAAYRKSSDGRVCLRGLVKHVAGELGAGGAKPIFQLPAGFRPSKEGIFACLGEGNAGSGAGALRIDVNAEGFVFIEGAFVTVQYVSLDTISFYPN